MSSGYTTRIGQYARRVGELLGLEEETLQMLEVAGELHDAGKNFIAEHILDKPGPLSDAEWEAMRRHPEFGAAIVRAEGHGDEVAGWIHHHHERLDGSGYPDGLTGEDIPLGSAILAVIDAYMGMTAQRPYREALPPKTALRELERGSGTLFHPEVVEVFVSLVRANLR